MYTIVKQLDWLQQDIIEFKISIKKLQVLNFPFWPEEFFNVILIINTLEE